MSYLENREQRMHRPYRWSGQKSRPILPRAVRADLAFTSIGGGYTFDLWGYQARVLAALRLGRCRRTEGDRSVAGFVDPRLKISVELIGAPALAVAECRQAPQQTLVGAMFTVTSPMGRYDEHKSTESQIYTAKTIRA
jgi:hypothetical protein